MLFRSITEVLGTADEIEVTTVGSVATVGLVHPVLLREPVLDWYDPTGGLPVAPDVGDRYIADNTANGWTEDYYAWRSTNPNLGATLVETK